MNSIDMVYVLSICLFLGIDGVNVTYAGTNNQTTVQFQDDTISGMVSTQASNISYKTEPIEWIIGEWKCENVLRYGLSSPILEKIESFCVFPFTDFRKPPFDKGTFIAAEFRTRNKHNTLIIADDSLPVQMFPGKIQAGVGMVWLFKYTHGRSESKHWLKLELKTEEDYHYVLLFSKKSDNPGKPLNKEFLFYNTPSLDIDEAGKYERQYQLQLIQQNK